MNDENIKEFLALFHNIKNLGYVKSVRSGNTGVGATFEYLIGKDEDQRPEPDYKGIEIKTKMYHTKTDISLFSANPSGNGEKETFRLVEKYGYSDSVLRDKKVLNCCAFANKNTIVADKFIFRLYVDYFNEKLFLYIYDLSGNLIDNTTYWNFEGLRDRLNQKMSILALVNTFRKITKEGTFYKYYKVKIYKLKDFDTFMHLIDIGYIRVVFKIGVFRTGERKGEIHDHGTSFQIGQDNLSFLYNSYI